MESLTTSTTSRAVTILLVEDEVAMLIGIKNLLEAATIAIDDQIYEATVMAAIDGREGIALLNQQIPDLIISDVMMPYMSGFEFLDMIQKNPAWWHIPFIFLTAYTEQKAQNEGRIQGANLYLTKPFDANTLLTYVAAQLKISFARRELQTHALDTFKKQILQILNHEFRTPLTYVVAYYDMLADGLRDASMSRNYKEFLHGIQSGCVRLTKLVNDFLALLSLNSGESAREFDQQATSIPDLTAVVETVVAAKTATAQLQETTIVFSPESPLPPIHGVSGQINQIVQRLLDNAIKFSPPASQVQVVQRVKNNEVYIDVIDNGIGLPQQAQEQIFDLFYQHNRAQTEQQGVGAGLTIAMGLARLHQGRIAFKNNVGKGSTFTLVLPIHEAAGQTAVAPQPTATVIAVEDDATLLKSLQDLLETISEKYALNVLPAQNGQEALTLLQSHKPDLIISDILMPNMSGYDLLNIVRQNPDWLNIPFIFLSAKGEPPAKEKAYILGVDEYLTKPYEGITLVRFVESQLDRRFKLQRQISQNFNDLKYAILNMVSPSFQQPLRTVSTYTTQLGEQLEDANTLDTLKESLEGIQANTLWLQRLIEDFISLAELKTGETHDTFHVEAQVIQNISFLLSGLTQFHNDTLAEQGIHLECLPMPAEVTAVYGDVSLLSKSLDRLLEVGIRHSDPDDAPYNVYLAVEESETHLDILIKFMSHLMPNRASLIKDILQAGDDDLQLIRSFELGPDLSIARGYITVHNGRIDLEDNEMSGFTFRISLPIHTTSY